MDGASFSIGFSIGGVMLLGIVVAIIWLRQNERI